MGDLLTLNRPAIAKPKKKRLLGSRFFWEGGIGGVPQNSMNLFPGKHHDCCGNIPDFTRGLLVEDSIKWFGT